MIISTTQTLLRHRWSTLIIMFTCVVLMPRLQRLLSRPFLAALCEILILSTVSAGANHIAHSHVNGLNTDPSWTRALPLVTIIFMSYSLPSLQNVWQKSSSSRQSCFSPLPSQELAHPSLPFSVLPIHPPILKDGLVLATLYLLLPIRAWEVSKEKTEFWTLLQSDS